MTNQGRLAIAAPAASPTTPFDSAVAPGLARLGTWRGGVKRAVDVLGSAVLLLCLSPVFLGISILIRLDSRGPALFRQTRLGRDRRSFTVFKFRTMRVDASDDLHRAHVSRQISREAGASPDERGRTFKLVADPRVTRLGVFLRRASLDELPQLVNVLRGDMSLVGPRPPLVYEVQSYEPWQFERLQVRPGLTGLWQVSGRSRLSYRQMCELDVEYVRRWSLSLDLEILARTLPVVLSNSGSAG